MGRKTFSSLRFYNYRIWVAGALVSNIGTWMQRVAQDWLVLTVLTDADATAVGIVTALQFGPQILLLPLTGYAADRMDRRTLLAITQAAQGLLALCLGLLTISGYVELWHVFVFGALLGCTTAFDAPARQSFVSDLVPETHLANAVALNSANFNASRTVGPAVAGVLIAVAGSGWAFIINAASFAAVLFSLSRMRRAEFYSPNSELRGGKGSLLDGFRYVWQRRDLSIIMCMFFLIGSFGLNFPIYIATMAATVFHMDAQGFGLLTATLATGSVTGAVLAAGRDKPTPNIIVKAALMFGIMSLVGALMPGYLTFAVALFFIGISVQTFTTSANAFVQLSATPAVRGRVLALLLTIALGGQAMGAPLVGWIADAFGPRWALAVGALSALISYALGRRMLLKKAAPASPESLAVPGLPDVATIPANPDSTSRSE